jgi:hypothetical protein
MREILAPKVERRRFSSPLEGKQLPHVMSQFETAAALLGSEPIDTQQSLCRHKWFLDEVAHDA